MKIKLILFIIILINLNCFSQNITDTRDSLTYKTIQIGNQTWMAENLRYETLQSVSYNNNKKNDEIYGKLYPINDAIAACPENWHLPSDSEWMELEQHLGMAENELNIEGQRGNNINSKLQQNGFNQQYSGTHLNSTKMFYGIKTEAYYWTATKENAATSSQMFSTIDYEKEEFAWFRAFYSDADFSVRRYFSGAENFFSVRCVKNKQEPNK